VKVFLSADGRVCTGWRFLCAVVAITIVVGALLALAYLRTGALCLPFGIHLGWNLTLGLVYAPPVSGITLFAVLNQGHADGPTWLTGGDYGIEASLTGMLVYLLGIAVVAFMRASDREKPAPAGVARPQDLNHIEAATRPMD